ncbi:MAG: D-aminoacyl-tRNA deacylase [Planctomycetota bacterium]|nr:D-aminoacyl-tRNA deacylase [Planctomycetota bacterium]
MRAVIQRVRDARVEVDGEILGQIGIGFLVLVGVGRRDSESDAMWLAKKIAGLRVFRDEEDRMNLNLNAVDGSILLVSQFTLQADCRQGNRPSFTKAAPPEEAAPLIEIIVERLRNEHQIPVETGRFGADMKVSLLNAGPVTIILDSIEDRRPG